MPAKRSVLVLCTGNSARSQMGEGLINARLEGFEAYSAGTRPAPQVNPNAIAALADIGIDISSNRPKSVDEFKDRRFDFVITVCGSADANCPAWIGKVGKRCHIGFEDPSHTQGTPNEILDAFKKTRDMIEDQVFAYLRSQ
ncbi:Protein ArsC [Trichoplax sp. H2]|nr:Protein ArsC [Trichoplax sp. H2]|eukprot:RDD37213.1 Protein ArsC [Trichoplax sp. H2]